MTDNTEYLKTVDEAVNRLLSDIPIHEKRRIANLPEDGLVNLHFGLGQGIRNDFGLWAGNEALLESCRQVAGKAELHVDSASTVIIKALWARLQEYPPPKLVREGVTYEF